MNGGETMKRLSTSFPVGDTPLDEYPRPQMVRAQWQNLNGLWQYAVTESPEQPAVWQGGIRVPFAPESALSGVEKPVLPGQTLWYFRTFSINGYDAAKRTLLHFGAVDYACTVFVNGREAGGHTGGYCPFTLDITSFVRAAENELTVAVTDDTDKGDTWQTGSAPQRHLVYCGNRHLADCLAGAGGQCSLHIRSLHTVAGFRGGLRPDQRKRQRMHGSVGGGFMHHRPHVYGGRQPDGFV